MVKYIKVNTSRLNKAAQSVADDIAKMKAQMKKMKVSVKQLDAMWDGESSEAFKKAFQDDMAALEVILNNLQSMHSYEVTAKNKYETCEQKVSELVAGIRV